MALHRMICYDCQELIAHLTEWADAPEKLEAIVEAYEGEVNCLTIYDSGLPVEVIILKE